jgi:hypothetical protein
MDVGEGLDKRRRVGHKYGVNWCKSGGPKGIRGSLSQNSTGRLRHCIERRNRRKQNGSRANSSPGPAGLSSFKLDSDDPHVTCPSLGSGYTVGFETEIIAGLVGALRCSVAHLTRRLPLRTSVML